MFDMKRIHPASAAIRASASSRPSAISVASIPGLTVLPVSAMRSGCTTASDHLYLFPNDVTLDAAVPVPPCCRMKLHGGVVDTKPAYWLRGPDSAKVGARKPSA